MITPLRALLADDERLARKRLRKLLLAHPEIKVIGESHNVTSTVAFAEQEKPDVIFLDIQMPPGCGFDVLPLLAPPLPKIVFVTAHDQFAVKAFRANALDYLLKPVHAALLAETVQRLCSASTVAAAQNDDPAGRLCRRDLVTLRDKGMLRIVPACQIASIVAEGAYSRILLSGQAPMLLFRSICEWENRLSFPPFTRIDRSLLVNLDLVRAVDVLSRGETHLRLEGVPEPLILGRAASTRLRKLLSD